MTMRQQHNPVDFDENLAFRLSHLMRGGRLSSAAMTARSMDCMPQVGQSDIKSKDDAKRFESKQLQRATAASMSALLSRPTLMSAAARVINDNASKESTDSNMGTAEMRSKLQAVLRHSPQLRALINALPHLFFAVNSTSASIAGSDALIDGAGRGGLVPMVALEGWAHALSHEIATFNEKPFSFQLRDQGDVAVEHKSLLEQLVHRGRPLLQRKDIVACGCSDEGAAAAAAWLEAVFGDNVELVERCARAMPVLLAVQDGGACTALHIAAASGSSRVVSSLLGHGAVLWSRDCWGRLPMHALCVGAAMSEYAVRRQQARTTFVDVFSGLELDGRIPCNDSALRVMAGKDHDGANDNCWLRCMRRMLQYSGTKAVDVAVCRDDKGFSCAQYAAAADSVMQLGLLQLLLQCTAKDGGDDSWALLLRHKQQLQLTARCLHHAAALQYVTNLLDQKPQIEEEANAAQQHVHLKERTTTTQQLLLRTAASMKRLERGHRGSGTVEPNASDQKQMEAPLHGHPPAPAPASHPRQDTPAPASHPRQDTPAPASHPREDMMKFRQFNSICFVLLC
jgi:hypothetical protein